MSPLAAPRGHSPAEKAPAAVSLRSLDLDALEIATPCTVAWDAMEGDDRVRHCGACQLQVFNVREMTRSEAIALIDSRIRKGERRCLRLARRQDGTLVTREDCRLVARAHRRARWFITYASGLLVLALSLAVGTRLGRALAHRVGMGGPSTEPLPGWQAGPSFQESETEHFTSGDMDN